MANPEQIGTQLSDTAKVKLPNNDLEILHSYTLHNKGPSDAKRTEIKLMWPMLPLAGFNEQQSLLYGNDLPTITRISQPKSIHDRCFIYQPVGKQNEIFVSFLLNSLDNRISS